MARRATIVQVDDLTINNDRLLAKVTASTLYVSKLRELAARKAAVIEAQATAYYQGTINAIDDLLSNGIDGAGAPVSRVYVKQPTGADLAVPLAWKALSQRWRKDKQRRSGGGFTRSARGRGRSYGANSFWLDERKLSSAFRRQIVGKGKAQTTFRLKELKNGEFEIVFDTRFDKLPARYLDRVIRRALMQGAEGLGSIGITFSNIPTSELTSSSHPRGLARGGWAEARRPTMRPIAQRLGRAMKAQILKSLQARR